MITLKTALLNNSNFELREGIFFQKGIKTFTEFEKEYISLRKKEGRLLTDDEVRELPKFNSNPKLNSEWKIRSDSANRLIQYFKNKNKNKLLLDLGCGNGWLSNLIATALPAQVMALDRNEEELRQGAKIFNHSNLGFVYGDVYSLALQFNLFDSIVAASSIQYFPDLNSLITRLISLLKRGGEIHILDSPIYDASEVVSAKRRSSDYFTSLGHPHMPSFYFHHSWSELTNFNYQIIHRDVKPPGIFKKLFPDNSSPFPHLVIKTE